MNLPGISGLLRRLLPNRDKPAGPTITGSRDRSTRILDEARKFYERAEYATSPRRFERIKNRYGDVTGKVFFLPYLDTVTGETDAMRAAYKRMLASPYIKSALLYKVSAVASLDWQIQAANPDSARDREACEFLRYSIERTPEGMPGIIQAALAPMMIEGYGVSEKVPEVERIEPRWRGKVTLAAIKPKSTDLFDLEVDEHNNVLGVRGKGPNTGNCWPIRDFIYTRHLAIYDDPRGMSDFRAAYGDYWMHDTVSKLRAIHAEKKTSPFLLGEYQEQDDKSVLETALAHAKTSTWMVVPEGVKVQALNLAGQGEGDYKSFCDDKQKGMLIAILGAYLQVLEGQVPDGRGNASVSKGITELLIWLLAAMAQRAVTGQVFPDLIGWNYAGVGRPSLVLGGVSEQEVATILANISAAQQVGMKLSASDAHRRTGLQLANGPDDELKPLQSQAPAFGAGAGLGGAGGTGGTAGNPYPFSEEFDGFWDSFASEDPSWEPYTNPENGKSGAKSSGGRVLYGQAAIEVLKRVGKGTGKVAGKAAAAGAKAVVSGAKSIGRSAVSLGKSTVSVSGSVKDLVSRPMLNPKEIEGLKAAALKGGLHPSQVAELDNLAAPKVKAALATAEKIANSDARKQAVADAVRGGLTAAKIDKAVEAAKKGGMKGRALTRLERATDPAYRKKIADEAAVKSKELSLATQWHSENKQKFGNTAANAMYAAHWVGRLVARPALAVLTGGLNLIPGLSLASKLITGQIVRKVIRTTANVIKYGVVKPIRAITRQSEGNGHVVDSFAEISDDMVQAMREQLAAGAEATGRAPPDWSGDQIRAVLNALSEVQLTDSDVQEIESIDPDAVELALLLDHSLDGADAEMVSQIDELAGTVAIDDLAKLREGFDEAADPNAESTPQILDILDTDLLADATADTTAPAQGVAGAATFRGADETVRDWDWGLSLAVD